MIQSLIVAAACLAGEAPPEAAASIPVGGLLRVGGDMVKQVERTPGGFRSGTARITTPLPEGYPPPTPPGSIDIKHYPPVRRAQVTRDARTFWGMNGAFWPLFQHIKRRDIAMTSPVEMDYEGLTSVAGEKPDAWTMSFLYRRAEQGPLGPDRNGVEVVDADAVIVASLAYQGDYGVNGVRTHLRTLELWLESQEEWEQVGEPRALFYNGPEARSRDRWAEVQVPVRRRMPVGEQSLEPAE